MKSKLTLSLLLVMSAFQPAKGYGQSAAEPTQKERAPKKGTKAQKSKSAAAKKRKTPDEIRDERYEQALGWGSKKEAEKRRQEEAAAAAEISRGEQILQGQELFSFKTWVGSYTPKMDLNILFPASGEGANPDYAALEKEWAEAFPRFQKLQKRANDNTGGVRGEFEDPTLRGHVQSLYRVSLLRLRMSAPEQIGAWLRTEGEAWMRTWTALAFDEATPETLRFVSLQRQAYARELLQKRRSTQGAFPDEEVAFLLRSTQRPWPIDRVYMTEAKKTLTPGSQLVADGLVIDLQRFPFRTAEELRKVRRGGDLPGLKELDRVYTAEDVRLQQREEDLFAELALRCELGRYQKHYGSAAKSLDDLVKAGFLDKIPKNHATGKPWDMTQL